VVGIMRVVPVGGGAVGGWEGIRKRGGTEGSREARKGIANCKLRGRQRGAVYPRSSLVAAL
jgi:hypothetical protein